MKTPFLSFLLLLTTWLLFSTAANAQIDEYLGRTEETKTERDESKKKKAALESGQNNALYAEIGGTGIGYAAKYDRRFSSRTNGIGGQVGLGFYSFRNLTESLIIPFGLNYLIGRYNHFLELGVGSVCVLGGYADEGMTTTMLGTYNITYRYQPFEGRMVARLGWSPVLSFDGGPDFVSTMPSLSLGYSF